MVKHDEDQEDSEETSELEKEFEALYEAHSEEINAQVTIAFEALNKAVELSEKYCIPFHSYPSMVGMSYTPESFFEKFSELDYGIVNDITEIYPEYEGWEHSAIC